jgi:cysteine desulfurase
MKKRQVYLDYAATTPVDLRVIKAMEPYWGKYIGNTMSLHLQGQVASAAVEKVRENIAKFIGAEAEEIVFTGSATESNNLTLKGVAEANSQKRKILISAIEHDCVVESVKWLSGRGYVVKEIPVNRDGLIDFEWFTRELTEDVLLVSVIHGNNEVGTIQDIGRVGSMCREKGVIFHTDASQSFGKVPIEVSEMKIDLLTASSHKIYGPKGAAILYVRNGVVINPILHGGGHEGGLRSSTVNVPAIVGMGKAVEISRKVLKSESLRVGKLRDKLVKGILDRVEDCWLNGDSKNRLSNNANISFARVEGEGLLLELDRKGIEVSTGSACSSRSLEPSHVLLAMGLTAPEAHGSIRFSLGRWTTAAEINYVLEVVSQVVAKLRKISPFKK